ncbi:hypothetical protein LT679_00675 [Mucilaginibacter roseus]|uniref:Uncharacterized protein n=1 Tax=Mucilaginibacter roseus TaxID=1528868 RepID=A0ABS8TW42_9SPHI|nr:hypothetical protein [Mucilaginibacter roseus]MCD8739099.1 hypothetical protein [Mucilaginibacter roseus]
MNEPFILAVNYQGTQHEFKSRFERWGYTHRIAVLIDEMTYTFEPDEESNYRVLSQGSSTDVEISLLKAIAEKLSQLSV